MSGGNEAQSHLIKDGGGAESQKPLSKRRKWQIKCRAKRLRRRERKKTLLSSSDKEGEVATTTESKHHISGSQKQEPKPAHSNGIPSKNVEKTVFVANRTDMKSSRKRKRKKEESVEEEAFAKMVDKYQRKLRRTAV